MNNFKDYGFEADFEGEILKQIGDILYGVVYVEYFGRSIICEWNTKGKVISNYKINEEAFELKPIKKWYENADNFPCLVYMEDKRDEEDKGYYTVLGNMNSYKSEFLIANIIRPATKEEVLSLLVKE